MKPGGRRFSPTRQMLELCKQHKISPTARLLGLVLAQTMRETFDEEWVVWRGRESLAEFTGFSTKTITKARRELLKAHLIMERRGGFPIVAKNGRRFTTARGVSVIYLVMNPTAFAEGERRSMAQMEDEVREVTHADRLQVQKQMIAGEISDDERRRLEDQIRQDARRRFALRRGNRIPPSNGAGDNAERPPVDAQATPSFPAEENRVPCRQVTRSVGPGTSFPQVTAVEIFRD